MKLLAYLLAVVLLGLCACSQKDSAEITAAAVDAYQTSYRDNVIRNWQEDVAERAECVTFREQMGAEGRKFASAASGGFVLALQRAKKQASAAGCIEKKATVATAAAAAYQSSYRDNVIRNWQNDVADRPECATYSAQMESEGRNFSSPASGKFINAIQRVKKSAAAAGCIKGK